MKAPFTQFIALFAVFLLVLSCKNDSIVGADPLHALPAKPVLLLEVNDAASFFTKLNQSPWAAQLTNKPEWESLLYDFERLKKIIPSDSVTFFLKKKKIWINYSLSGAEKYDFLFSASLEPSFYEIWMQKAATEFEVKTKDYEGVSLITLSQNGVDFMCLAYTDQVLLLSPATTLIEEGIRTLRSGMHLEKDLDFVKVRKTSNPKDVANVYLKPSEFYQYSKAKLRIFDQQWIDHVAQWIALDLQLDNSPLMLTGLASVPDSSSHYLTSFQKNSAVSTDASQIIIPTGIALWVHHGVGNMNTYYRQYNNYIELSGRRRNRDILLNTLPKNWEDVLINSIHKEFGVFWMSLPNLNLNNKIGYLRWSDIKNVESDLLPFSDSNFIEAHRELQIRRLVQQGMLQPVLGKAFNQINQPYYAVYANYVLLADNLEILKQVLNDLIDGRVLAKVDDYRKLEASLPDKFSMQIVCRQPESLPQASQILPLKWSQMIAKNQGLAQVGRTVIVQLNATADMAYVGLYTASEEAKSQLTRPLWTFTPQAKIAFGPQLVVNHLTQKDEVLIQDENNTLYLIGSAGDLIWKKQLEDRILGPVQQIDLYKNNRLQFLFACGKKVYVLDRNGKEVAPWPFVAHEVITAPVAVFDYDKIRNYRIFFAAANKLYNIDAQAQEVKGWKLPKIDAPLAYTAKHKVLGGKDYLLFQTLSGKAYVSDRAGNLRTNQVLSLPIAQAEFYLDDAAGSKMPFLTALAENAVMHNIFLNGKADSLALVKFKAFCRPFYAAPTATVAFENRLYVKDPKFPFEKKTDYAVTEAVIPQKIDAKIFYPLVYGAQELISVLNINGEPIQGMPVYGSSKPVIGKLGKEGYNLICITPEGAVINYLFLE